MEANGNIQQARNQVGPVPRNGVTPDVARARKIRKRQRTPTTLQEGNSEHIVLPNKDGVLVVSAAAKRRKMETKNEAKIIHGASDVDRSPLYDDHMYVCGTCMFVGHHYDLRSCFPPKGTC